MSTIRVDAAWWVGEAIADAETAVFAVTAGMGSGKTHGLAQWHHERVQRNCNSNFSAFIEPTYQKIHDTAIPKYKKVLAQFGLRQNQDFMVVKSHYPKIIYKNLAVEHEVHFISGENPDTIAGVEYSHASEDESGIIDAEVSRNVQSRLRDPAATVRQFFRGGAPQGINDFAAEFDSETLPGWHTSEYRDHWIEQEIEGVLVRKRRFIVWTDDNLRYLPPGYVQRNIVAPYGHNPNLIKSYRYGQFCPLVEGSAYSNYFPQKHDCEDREADPYREIELCLDFNKSPLAWVAAQCLPFDEGRRRIFRYVAIHEANEGHEHLDDAAVEFADKFPVSIYGNTLIALYGDRSGHSGSHKVRGSDFENFKKYLEELGFKNVVIRAMRQVAPEAASVDAVQRLLSKGLFYICKRCHMLKVSLMRTSWKKGVRKLDKPSGETWTHHGDAFKYFAYQEARDFEGRATTQIYGTTY